MTPMSRILRLGRCIMTCFHTARGTPGASTTWLLAGPSPPPSSLISGFRNIFNTDAGLLRFGPGLFNALYMNLIDCSAAMPPIARLYRVLATFSARLKRRMLAANERILAKTPGFLRIREASSAKLPSRT